MNYCMTSELGSAIRVNSIGSIVLGNYNHINISDEGLKNVFAVYEAEVLKAKKEMKPNDS